MAVGRESGVETFARSLQTVKLEYTTSGVDKPGIKDYDELAEVTRSFLDKSLQNFFSNIINVTYMGTALDFYRTRDISFVEYQFTTKWANGSQVPSITEVNNVTMQFFEGSSLKSYMETLHTELSSSNIFSSDTNVCLEECSSTPLDEDGSSASAEQSTGDSESNDTTTTVIAASLAAVGFVTGLAILAIYCRRRRRVQENEDLQMKPEASQCSTLDTNMMIPLDISVLDERGSGDEETMPEQQHRLLEDVPEENEQDGHFSEITLNAV